MASGLPASPFSAAPQASLSSLGWGIEWSSAEGRWVAAAQPGAKTHSSQEPLQQQQQQQRFTAAAQTNGLPGQDSMQGDSIGQLDRTASAGQHSAMSEAGHNERDAGAGMPSVQAAHGLPSRATISRHNSAASEVGMMAPDEAGLSHAAADAAAHRNDTSAADQGTASRRNSTCLQDSTGNEPGPAQGGPAIQRSSSGGPSRFRGVIWHKSNSKWEARIYEAGKQRFLGYYTSEAEAARVYDEAALRLTGRAVNFPIGPGGAAGLAESLSRANSAPEEAQDPDGGKTLSRGRPRKKSSQDSQPAAMKGSSRYRGVSWNSNCNRWRAQVWKGNDVRHLGYFDDEAEAARAYDRAAVELRGPAAATNFLASEALSEAVAAELAALVPEATQEEVDRVDSLFLGVGWNDDKGCWKAELWTGEGYDLLGLYDSEEAAARAYDRACLKQHGDQANTNFPQGEYQSDMAAAAVLDAVHLTAAASQGASEDRDSNDEGARRSELELSAMHALASISSDEAESFDSKAHHKAPDTAPEGSARHLSNPNPRAPSSAPAALRSAMSDPIEHPSMGLRRRKSARILDADAATAAAALTDLTGKPARRASRSRSRSRSPDQSASAGASIGRRNSGRSGPVASDQAKSSAYKGVSWHKHSQKWYAYIQSGGKMRGLGYFDSQADAAKAYDTEARKVHGKKAVVNFRQSASEIQWQPRNKRGASSSAETSCISFGASPEASEQSASAEQVRMRTGQRNPSRASSARSGRPRSASPAQEPAMSDGMSAEAQPPAGRPAARSRLAAESGFMRMSTLRPASAAGERPPPNLAPLNMAAIPPLQADRDGEGSPTESGMSMDSIPMRKRSRKPKHVYNAADVAPLQAPWKASTFKPKKDAQEAAKAAAALDQPMVLRSKDGSRAKRTRPESSLEPLPAISSGTEADRGEPRAAYRGVTRLEKERKWVARVWVDSKQKTVGRYDSDIAAAQAYDRAILRLKGEEAITNFPASSYGELEPDPQLLDASASAKGADASCTITLQDAGVSGESSHPSPSRAVNGPLPHTKSFPAAAEQLASSLPAGLERLGTVPGTKLTSTYRGVSVNSSTGMWTAVVWNPQTRAAQHIGDYTSELEAARAYDGLARQFGATAAQLNFPSSPEKLRASAEACGTGAGGEVSRSLSSAFTDFAQRAAAASAPQDSQEPSSQQGAQPRPCGQFTPVAAYEQLANLLRANPDTSPLIAQALHNLQQGPPGGQGTGMGPDLLQQPSSTQDIPDREPSRNVGDDRQPSAGAERSTPLRPIASRPNRPELTFRSRPQPQQLVMKNSSRFRGVSLNKASRKWEARIRESGKNHYLGSFTDEEAAARAFDNAAVSMRGPQAVCNFPREGSNVKVHTYGQAPARLIKVRASPDGPYQAVSTAPDAGPPTWASVAQQRGAPERLSGQPGPSSSVHYDAASGMWVSEGTEGDQGRHETPPKQPSAEGVRSPGVKNMPAAPFMPNLGSIDIDGGEQDHQQRILAALLEQEEARPGPGPGRRSSKFKGVSWAEASLKWRTQIWTGTKVQYIGYYDEEVEAAKAYDRAILKFRGPGHHINFPEGQYTAEEIASAPKVEPVGDEPVGIAGGSPRAGQPAFPEPRFEGSPRGRLGGPRGSLSPRQGSQPRTTPTGRAAPDSQVYHQGTSQFKGVSWAERSKKWRAQLWFGNKVNHLGFFEYEEEAARAYDAAARAIRGPQASTNFPDANSVMPAGHLSARTITMSSRPGDSSTVVETIPRINVNPKGSSMYKGVRWHERNGKWEARIFDSAAQKQVSLGYYEKELDAARAYDAESLRLRGPSGHVNLPESRQMVQARPQAAEAPRDSPAGQPSGAEDLGDDKWAIKRPRGTNPAIERGDLEAIAAVAAAVASAGQHSPSAAPRPQSSQYRGVVWDEESQRWAVCLSPADGQPQKQLGLFYTEEAAASAYDQLAVELWGPSTPTNFGASGVAVLPEGAQIPKKPRTDSAAASRQNAAMFLDAADVPPADAAGAAGPSALRARSAQPAAGRAGHRAVKNQMCREDTASAAAASDLVDFFQTAAQRLQGKATLSGPGNSALVSDAQGARPGAAQQPAPAEMLPTAESMPKPEQAAPVTVDDKVVTPPKGAPAAEVPQDTPISAAILSWQPTSTSSGGPPAGIESTQGAEAMPVGAEAMSESGAQHAGGAAAGGTEAVKIFTPLVASMPNQGGGLVHTGAPSIQDKLAAADSGAPGASAAADEVATGAPAPAHAEPHRADKAAPKLITPPKEASVPVAASRPFSADTA